MKLRLIRTKNPDKQHVSVADVYDFETTAMELFPFIICNESGYFRKAVRPSVAGYINKLLPKTKAPAFCISMGINGISRSFPHLFLSSGNILYLFDAWPGSYELIGKTIKAYNIGLLLTSSRESAAALQKMYSDICVLWCPEGIRNTVYRAYDYSQKDIDVIQIGRKYDLWHNRVVGKLKHSGISYVYEKVKGEVIFRHRTDFFEGLGRSRISVCFPRSVTHTEKSGGLTTMTNRYLQSAASKCLILGIIPGEMKDLFGYDPGITADMNDPAGQIKEILDNFKDYIPLIEKNYSECLRNHDWADRWRYIEQLIQRRKKWNTEV